jgi:hypothetical protein
MAGEPAGLNRSLPGPLRCDVLQLDRPEQFQTALSTSPSYHATSTTDEREKQSYLLFPPSIMNKVFEALASEETLHLIHNPAQRQTLLDQLIADRWSSEDERNHAFAEAILYFSASLLLTKNRTDAHCLPRQVARSVGAFRLFLQNSYGTRDASLQVPSQLP